MTNKNWPKPKIYVKPNVPRVHELMKAHPELNDDDVAYKFLRSISESMPNLNVIFYL